jgi:hypothetical protein
VKYLKIAITALSLSTITIQPVNQFAEAIVHFRHAKVAGIELSFAQAEAQAAEVIEKAEAEPEYRTAYKGDVVAAQALTWQGTHFKEGVSARCADFVRHVLQLEGVTLATPRGSAGPLMADSFYNADEGTIILDPKYLRPGDIVMHSETYNGGGRVLPGARGNRKITHVGIVVSDCSTGSCMMVDRSTRSRPVNYRSIHTEFRKGYGSHFHSGLRPHAYSQP